MAELHLSRHSKPLWLLFGESADPFIPSFAAVGLCIVTFGTRGLVLHGTGTNCSAVWKRELSLADGLPRSAAQSVVRPDGKSQSFSEGHQIGSAFQSPLLTQPQESYTHAYTEREGVTR